MTDEKSEYEPPAQESEKADADIDDRRFTDPRGRTRGRVAGLRLKAPNNQ